MHARSFRCVGYVRHVLEHDLAIMGTALQWWLTSVVLIPIKLLLWRRVPNAILFFKTQGHSCGLVF